MSKVIIRYNPGLDKVCKTYCLTLPGLAKSADQPTDMDLIKQSIKRFRTVWEPIEDGVFAAIEAMTGQVFPYSRVNANIVWTIDRTEAFGMVIPGWLTADAFIMTLTHELMHLSGGKSTQKALEFKDEAPETRVHLLIHAMTESLWRDTLKRPDYVDSHKNKCLKNKDTDYIRAWEIVEQKGYKNIIENYLQKGNLVSN